MTKTVTIRLDDETYEEFREAAAADNRPISNLIETAALAKIRDEQFVDDVEMAEIQANVRLLESLEKGAKDAKAGRGRFVG
jgi:predicted transcriptional regulator